MTLARLIEVLESAPRDMVVKRGFSGPHSYRGYYDQLAFKHEPNTTVGEMLECAKSANGKTFTGYKGGEYEMNGETTVNIANYGCCGEEIGELLLSLMIGGSNA